MRKSKTIIYWLLPVNLKGNSMNVYIGMQYGERVIGRAPTGPELYVT